MNSIGTFCTLTVYGESHGPSIGAVLDGLPAGAVIDWDEVRREMARRAPGRSALATARKEADAFTVESGYFAGHTTGTPLAVRIANGDQHSKDYDLLRHVMRPGHADYAGRARYGGWNDYRGGGHFSGRLTAPLAVRIANGDQHSKDYDLLRHVMRPGHADYAGRARYGGWNDYRGGGHFSGRLTAPLVFAGAVAKQLLRQEGVAVGAHILQIADVRDASFPPLGVGAEALAALSRDELPLLDRTKETPMREAILAAKNDGDSVGGVIECMAEGLPAGVGDPLFDAVESCLAQMLFAVPAVKGVEFGDGFALAGMRGSEANDPLRMEDGAVRPAANHNGGITGGLTDGAPILFRVAVKPTPSIARPQQTVDLDTGENTALAIRGRHDPCIVPRAVPVIEAAAAWVLLDLLLESRVRKGGRP